MTEHPSDDDRDRPTKDAGGDDLLPRTPAEAPAPHGDPLRGSARRTAPSSEPPADSDSDPDAGDADS